MATWNHFSLQERRFETQPQVEADFETCKLVMNL
jgi:hypothetical protein